MALLCLFFASVLYMSPTDFPFSTQPKLHLLAIDSSTEQLSLAIGTYTAASQTWQQWQYTGAGAEQASGSLLPEAMCLLKQAGLTIQQLHAIVVGIGPGSFTGLRTACAVAQGLALGADIPVLPISTLLAVAEDWRMQYASEHNTVQVCTLLDARMREVYAAQWQYQRTNHTAQWLETQAASLIAPEAIASYAPKSMPCAGNVASVYGAQLTRSVDAAMPTASALLRLAPALLQQGKACDAALLLPTYVRNKVAQTTAERLAQANKA